MGEGLELTIDELAERAGVPVRTVRYYIAERLLPGPGTRGTAAAYGEDHLLRLQFIRRLAESGLTLAEIRTRQLAGLPLEEVKALLSEEHGSAEGAQQADSRPAPRDYVSALLSRARRARSLAEGSTTEPRTKPSTDRDEDAGPVGATPSPSLSTQPGPWSAFPPQAGVSYTGANAWHRFELLDGVELHVREDVLRREGQSLVARINALVASLFRRTRR